jgi:hypothetical protein
MRALPGTEDSDRNLNSRRLYMKRMRYALRQCFTALVTVLLIGMAPAPAFAAEGSSGNNLTDNSTQAANTTGPTGVAAGTYTYNDSTGLWENDYYTYNPSTKETVPKTPLEFTYNPSTGKWDSRMWQYVASQGAYLQEAFSVEFPPAGAITHGGPSSETKDEQKAPADSTQSSDKKAPDSTGNNVPNGSVGDNQQNNSRENQSKDTGLSINTAGTLTNNINSTANSGNALVVNNDDVGGAATGNATTVANVANLLQSQASFSNPGGLATFTANIQGNLNGDFLIDPATLMQPANISQNDLAHTTINTKTNGTIANNINLNANSGNANVNNNDDIGAVSTGNANAVADVINMINSVVAANQSFLGVVNIYGDYSGNILMPADSLNALLGSNANQSSTAVASANTTTNTSANVTNNINLAAASGNANVSNNDDVGSVATGNGMTNLTILNLTGKQVIAANSLLVFVNVLGSWVGLIMDAPTGATSAALGGGVNSHSNAELAGSVTNNENFGITNNIAANARSGNADVTNNDDIGSVATGNATSSANIANLINSNFSLSNWFGVLFINVFGNWHGNFGVAKPPVITPITSGVAVGPGPAEGIRDARAFAFVPKSSGGSGAGYGLQSLGEVATVASRGSNPTSTGSSDEQQAGHVLGITRDSGKGGTQPPAVLSQNASDSFNYVSVILFSMGALGLGYVGIERFRSNLRQRYLTRA